MIIFDFHKKCKDKFINKMTDIKINSTKIYKYSYIMISIILI
jgi:hypothetical protein